MQTTVHVGKRETCFALTANNYCVHRSDLLDKIIKLANQILLPFWRVFSLAQKSLLLVLYKGTRDKTGSKQKSSNMTYNGHY